MPKLTAPGVAIAGDAPGYRQLHDCVQCGAITAKGGRLTTPEGGDGPLYQNT